MLVASIIVETLPGKARAVAERMEQMRGMGPLAAEGDRRVVATWTVPDNDTIEGLSEVLQAMNPEIICVYPSMIGEEES
jgi:hypothetical protein